MSELDANITVFDWLGRRDPKTCDTEIVDFEDGSVIARMILGAK